jgi:hypothetical protein
MQLLHEVFPGENELPYRQNLSIFPQPQSVNSPARRLASDPKRSLAGFFLGQPRLDLQDDDPVECCRKAVARQSPGRLQVATQDQ